MSGVWAQRVLVNAMKERFEASHLGMEGAGGGFAVGAAKREIAVWSEGEFWWRAGRGTDAIEAWKETSDRSAGESDW